MAVQVISWVIREAPADLTATEMLVLLMLAEHADSDGGHAHPLLSTLARETRCGKRTVSRALNTLVDRGVIDVEEPSTRHLPTMYCFPVFRLAKMATLEKNQTSQNGVSKESRLAKMAVRVAKMATTTVIQPSDDISTPNVVDISIARTSKKCLLPDQWEPTPQTIAGLTAKGWLPEQIERQRDEFIVAAQANGYQYVDWQAAFRKWFTSQYQKERPGVRGSGHSNGYAAGSIQFLRDVIAEESAVNANAPDTVCSDEQAAAGSGLPPAPSPPSVTERDAIDVAFQEGHRR